MRLQRQADLLAAAVAKEIQTRRLAADLSMNQIATRTGLSVSFIGYLERGQRRPSVETLAKVAWALGVSLTDLLSRVEPPIWETVKKESFP